MAAVAVDHWNTDNPHVHVLVRGRANDGRDLVISRDYISRGFRARAEQLVDLELGPRSAREIDVSLDAEVTAERWTGLDRALRSLSDETGGVADLRPGSPDPRDPDLRRSLIGRAQPLESLGFAEQHAPAVWALMRTPHLGDGPHQVVAQAARELLNKSENERSGVLSTAKSFLGLYRDPVVARVTRRCDWRIDDLVSGDRPVSLYLVVPPSDISRTKPLIRLVLN